MSDAGMEADQPQGDGKEGDNPDLHKIARWVAEIELYDRETSKWKKQGQRIIKRYKDDRGDRDDIAFGSRFNAFWANVQTMRPSLYARNPKPDIQRRFKDNDPVGRVASDVLERSVSYFTNTDDFYEANQQAVTDYLLPGRGVCWERYVPHFKQAPELAQEVEITDDTDGSSELPEVIDYEETITDFVHRDDFGHNICRTWKEVWCAWRIVYMDRQELVERFKDKGKTIPLDYVQKNLNDEKMTDGVSKASIYELWDKTRKVAAWFHKTVPDALDLRPDPLGLDNFWPFPKPLFTNLANDSLIPTPDFVESQDQYLELDDLTSRISAITKSLKVAGIYDASAEGINRLLNEGVENKLIPIEGFAVQVEKGGLEGAISWLPIDVIAKALMDLYQARDKVKEDLHEISGIPDIARGESDANETLGAQQIKANFAINRISDKQRDVQRFVRELVRIKVDVICGHFQLDTIKAISGVRLFTQQEKAEIKQFQQASQMAQQTQAQPGGQVQALRPMPPPQPPQALHGLSQDQIENMMSDPSWEEVDALIRNNAMRCFRIDIETDSTIKADEESDKNSRIEFITAIGKYMAEALPAGQQTPELVPFLLEGLQFLANGFPVGKNMESALNVAIQKLEKLAQNPPPKQDPEMAKVQMEAQARTAELQAEMQLEQQKAQLQAQTEQAKAQSQAAIQQHLNQVEAERRTLELQQEGQLAQQKMEMESQIELKKAYIQQQTAIIVARIGAKASDGAEEEAMAIEEAGGPEDEDMKNTKEIHGMMQQLLEHLSKPQPQPEQPPQQDVAGAINNLAQAHHAANQNMVGAMNAHSHAISNLHKAVSSEKEIVRDPKTGKPTGVRVKVNPQDLGKAMN